MDTVLTGESAMRLLTASLIFAALSAGTTAQAADQPATPPTAAVAPATPSTDPSDDDKIVCKNVLITGSHFTQKVCAKKRLWNDAHDSSVNALDRSTQRSLQTVPGSPGSP